MAINVLILGESGTGKSFSLKRMNPMTTSIVNVQRKPLPFREKFPRMVETDSYAEIEASIQRTTSPSIVIDDFQYCIANDFMRRSGVKGYDKYSEMANSYWHLITVSGELPKEKIVYYLSHLDRDVEGNEKVKTIGKMLDEKICIEGMFTIVLKTVVQDGKFYFATVNNGHDTVKTPYEMFADPLIPNDLKFVDDSIRAFYGIEIKAPAPAGKEPAHANSLI